MAWKTLVKDLFSMLTEVSLLGDSELMLMRIEEKQHKEQI
jgi:hypothetical protein